PHEVEQQGFEVIVLMLCYRYAVVTERSTHGLEPCVAQVARCHLDGNAICPRVRLGIECRGVERHVQLTGKPVYQCFIRISLRTAQLEITVGDADDVAGTGKKMSHQHRILATAHGKQYAVVGTAQCLFIKELRKSLLHTHMAKGTETPSLFVCPISYTFPSWAFSLGPVKETYPKAAAKTTYSMVSIQL